MRVIEEAQLEIKRKLPWFVDALLYPVSIAGIVHIIIFLLLPILLKILRFLLLGFPINLLFFAFILVFIGYLLHYLCDCVLDSAKGGFRAPSVNIEMYSLDKWDCISQLLLVLACLAISFAPAAAYYFLTEQANIIFYLLALIGVFFLPMSLLRGIMFDATDALNPVIIIYSISKAFLPYLGLVLFFCVVIGSAVFIAFNLPRSRLLFIALYCFCIYLTIVAFHLLGRFYWFNKDKLEWGI